MSDDDRPAKTPTEVLAELVAQRKARAGAGPSARTGMRRTERDAAARSSSKSKPALRK